MIDKNTGFAVRLTEEGKVAGDSNSFAVDDSGNFIKVERDLDQSVSLNKQTTLAVYDSRGVPVVGVEKLENAVVKMGNGDSNKGLDLLKKAYFASDVLALKQLMEYFPPNQPTGETGQKTRSPVQGARPPR